MTDGFSRRILDVNAYTTLDYVEVRVAGHDWSADAVGVLDVDDVEDPETGEPVAVSLSLEVDGADVERLPQHATHVELSAADARTLASALVGRASEVDGESGS